MNNKSKKIYLDHNASSFLQQNIIDQIKQISVLPLNASSLHSYGQKALRIIESSKNNIKKN